MQMLSYTRKSCPSYQTTQINIKLAHNEYWNTFYKIKNYNNLYVKVCSINDYTIIKSKYDVSVYAYVTQWNTFVEERYDDDNYYSLYDDVISDNSDIGILLHTLQHIVTKEYKFIHYLKLKYLLPTLNSDIICVIYKMIG